MKEPVIVHSNIRSKIKLEGDYDYDVLLTIGLADKGDFYLVIDFPDLTPENFKTLTDLGKMPKSLAIQSEFIENEKYNITHIAVTRITANNLLSMTWECLSDDPELYEGLIIK